jgi:hypothetical protein
MLTTGYFSAMPISKPLQTMGVGHSLASFCAAGISQTTLYSRKWLLWSMV